MGTFEFDFSPSSTSKRSIKFKVKVRPNAPSTNNNSKSTQPDTNQTETTKSSETQSSTNANNSSENKLIIAGHSFHRSNFHGTDIWVGDNHEGELGEWAANAPEILTNPQLKAQVEAQLKTIYNN